MREDGRGGGSEIGSDLDRDPDPSKMLLIRSRQNKADPSELDPQHCCKTPLGVRFFPQKV